MKQTDFVTCPRCSQRTLPKPTASQNAAYRSLVRREGKPKCFPTGLTWPAEWMDRKSPLRANFLEMVIDNLLNHGISCASCRGLAEWAVFKGKKP